MNALGKLLLVLAVSVIFAGQPAAVQAAADSGLIAIGEDAPRVKWRIGQDKISVYTGSPRLLQEIPYDYDAVNLPDIGDDERVVPEDMNFDGYFDLKIVAGRGIANIYYHCWLWDQKQQQFVLHEALSELASPQFDADTQTIHSFFHGSAVDSKEAKYTFKNGQLRLVSALEHALDPQGRVVAREYRVDEQGAKRLVREWLVADESGEAINE